MNIQTAYRASPATDLGRPRCPRCGSIVLMAERAAFNPDGGIRHTWSCDDCGHEFVTSIRMRGRQPTHKIAS
jgi:DNA-directed RNA polymerase subunit RPC12/RpoP